MKPEYVKIPTNLLHQMVNVLELLCDRRSGFGVAPDFEAYLESILSELRLKQRAFELRAAYSKMVTAKTDDERHYARIEYLRLKREINLTD